MEEKKESKLWLGIVIGLLIAVVVGLGTFIVYDKVISNDKKGNEKEKIVEPTPTSNSTSEPTVETKNIGNITYTIKDNNGDLFGNELYINGKKSHLSEEGCGFKVLGVIDDKLLVERHLFDGWLYILDKDDNEVEYKYLDEDFNDEFPAYFYNGTVIDGNTFTVTRSLGQDPDYWACEHENDADFIIKKKVKFELVDGKFIGTTIEKKNAKEYLQENNKNCDWLKNN